MLSAILVMVTAQAAAAVSYSDVAVNPEHPRVALAPPRHVVKLHQGQSANVEIIVSNYAPRRFAGTVEPRDLVPAKDPGSFVRTTNGTPKAAGLWLTPETGVLRLPPGKRANFNVVVRVPPDARPGVHAAAVVVTESHAGQRDGVAVKMRATLVGQLILEISGDARTAAHLERMHAPRFVRWGETPTFSAEIVNDGDTLLRANGEVELSAFAGIAAQQLPFTETLVLPDARRTVTSTWTEVPWFGWFTPTMTVTSEAGTDTASYPTVFVVPPWWVIAIVIATLLLPLGHRWRRRRRYRARYRDYHE